MSLKRGAAPPRRQLLMPLKFTRSPRWPSRRRSSISDCNSPHMPAAIFIQHVLGAFLTVAVTLLCIGHSPASLQRAYT